MLKFWKMFSFWGFMIASPPTLAAEDLLLGFQLGGTLAQAQSHATSSGWKLRPLSTEIPGQWVVDGAEAGLTICENRVLAVQRTFEGGVEEFAIMIQDGWVERGLPETSIVTFRSGKTRISNIDARYKADDGSGATVQLNSADGELKIHTNVWSSFNCLDQKK